MQGFLYTQMRQLQFLPVTPWYRKSCANDAKDLSNSINWTFTNTKLKYIKFTNTIAHRSQARSQVLRLGGTTSLRCQEFCFYYMFETKFSGHNKIWGTLPPWLQAWSAPQLADIHWHAVHAMHGRRQLTIRFPKNNKHFSVCRRLWYSLQLDFLEKNHFIVCRLNWHHPTWPISNFDSEQFVPRPDFISEALSPCAVLKCHFKFCVFVKLMQQRKRSIAFKIIQTLISHNINIGFDKWINKTCWKFHTDLLLCVTRKSQFKFDTVKLRKRTQHWTT